MKKTNIFNLLLGFFLIISAGTSCKKDGPYSTFKPANTYPGTIYDYISSHPDNFKNLLSMLDKCGLSEILKQDSVTFFLPTDQSLSVAMDEYNVYRRSQRLDPVTMNDIDSSSWRYIIAPYIMHGVFRTADFDSQDGLAIRSIALRDLHGKLVSHTASGAKDLGTTTIQFSYTNGSRFTRDWISSYVATPGIEADNGIIHILENRHILGFNYFINKAREPQNIYSDEKCYASGTILFPNTSVRIWTLRIKKLKALEKNIVQAEAADLLESGYLMDLIIHENDSVTVTPDPLSANQTLENNGRCYFDPVTLTFILNYHYMGDDGYREISETIKYTAE